MKHGSRALMAMTRSEENLRRNQVIRIISNVGRTKMTNKKENFWRSFGFMRPVKFLFRFSIQNEKNTYFAYFRGGEMAVGNFLRKYIIFQECFKTS